MKTLALLSALSAGCGGSLVPDLHLTLTSRRFHVLSDPSVGASTARERWAHGLYATVSLSRAAPAPLRTPRGAPRRLPTVPGRLACVVPETCEWERSARHEANRQVTRQLARGGAR